jgi:hypothetical protein
LVPDEAAAGALSAYLTASAQSRRPLGSEGFVGAALERLGAAPPVTPSADDRRTFERMTTLAVQLREAFQAAA